MVIAVITCKLDTVVSGMLNHNCTASREQWLPPPRAPSFSFDRIAKNDFNTLTNGDDLTVLFLYVFPLRLLQ